jgi:tetratricopeptide (TPR) repeat protein
VPIHWLAAMVARAKLALGAHEEALAIWRRLAAPGFDAVPRNIRWTRSIAEIAHLCADLERRESASDLLALLEPVAHQHSAIPIPVAYGGPLRHALARLYALEGRRSLAERAYTQALEDCERVGAEVWRAHVLLDAAASAPDGKRARAALAEAQAIAVRIGQAGVARAAEAALAQLERAKR